LSHLAWPYKITKDCGKKEEICDFSSINLYKIKVLEKEDNNIAKKKREYTFRVLESYYKNPATD
jgi:hypothetical protein